MPSSPPDNIANGPIAANAGAVLLDVSRHATATVTLTGTWVGTVQFEVTTDNVTWVGIPVSPIAGGALVTSATANGTWSVNVAAYDALRLRASAWTSGAATVAIRASAAGGGVPTLASGSIPFANASGALVSSIGLAPGANGSVAPMAIISNGSAAPYYASSDGLRSALVGVFDNNPIYTPTSGITFNFRLESVPLGSITVTNGGTGFPTNATNGTVTLSGGDAITPATAHYTSNGSGVITSVVLDTPGLYRSAPNSIVFGGGGTGATAYANMAGIGKTPLDIRHYDIPDTGQDNSGALVVSTGGNGSLTTYQIQNLRPVGTRKWGMTLQGAIETGTDAGSQAIIAFPGMSFPSKERSLLTVDVASGAGVPATITLTSGTGWPVPGAYEYTAPGGGVLNYPSTLYAQLTDPTTGNTETFAYTAISGNVLTISARGVGGSAGNFAFTQANGSYAEPQMRSMGVYARVDNHVSDGFLASPGNNVFDTSRYAYAVGTKQGGTAPTNVKFSVRMNGRIESASGAFLAGAAADGSFGLSVNGLAFANTYCVGQSATSPDPTGASLTIGTSQIGVARVTPTANRTAVILQAGIKPGQVVTVVNESASFSATFDVAGTSHVSNGASCVVAALTAKRLIWDSSTSLWYPHA